MWVLKTFLVGAGALIVGASILHSPMRSFLPGTGGREIQVVEQKSLESCQRTLDALDETWDLRRDIRRNHTKNLQQAIGHLFDLFEPEAVCFDDERFGTEKRYLAFGDGPKFVCGVDRIVEKAQNNKDCLVYSVGSNNHIEFEVAITKTMGEGKCEVHTFDPTVVPDTFVGKHVAEFHDWGFGQDGRQTVMNHKRGRFEFTEMSLETAVKRLGHENRTIDIFKIDCEGCEYEALTEAFRAISQGKIKIDQVQVEVHGGQHPKNFPIVKRMFEAADNAGMRVFHKERNGWGCQGYKCIEYAFVSKDFLRKANGHYVCPSLSSEMTKPTSPS